MNFSKSKIIFVLCVSIFSIIVCLQNFLNFNFLFINKINFGLDLQGGSQILLEINYEEYIKDQLNLSLQEIKSEFRKNKIRLVPRLKSEFIDNIRYNNIVITNVANEEKNIIKIIKKVNPKFEIAKENNNLILKFNKDKINSLSGNLLQQSMEIVKKRIDEIGTKEVIVQSQGKNKILVQAPGMQNPDELKNVLGKTAKMTFHFLNTSILDEDNIPTNVLKLKLLNLNNYFYVNKEVVLDGDLLQNASVVYSEGKPSISFSFNRLGSKKFAEITKNNIGKNLAIVLDNEIITAPTINTPIPNGSGIITGNFTYDEASKIAILLRAGSLPAPLKIVEERVVGPSLGENSIKKGLYACLSGFIFVLLFMIVLYKFFGIVTDIALIMNLIITVTCLSILGATLTLPGIAGIVLSIGMAVDTNILIFERIKEEYKNTNSIYSSIESGFDFAWGTIFDSNITTLLIGIILYSFGTGMIKGFALVLCIGIFASLFSGVLLTKLLLYIWLIKFNPKKIKM